MPLDWTVLRSSTNELIASAREAFTLESGHGLARSAARRRFRRLIGSDVSTTAESSVMWPYRTRRAHQPARVRVHNQRWEIR